MCLWTKVQGKYIILVGKNYQESKLIRLNIESHVGSTRKNSFTRTSGYMKPVKSTLNIFFSSQFSYCPLRWIFHNKELNYKIKRLHERWSCVLCDENSLSIHYRIIQVLATQIFRIYKVISKKINRDVHTDPTFKL